MDQSQRNEIRPKTNDIPHPPKTLPSRGAAHGLFSLSAVILVLSMVHFRSSPGAGRGPSAYTRIERDARMDGEERIKWPHLACLLFYPRPYLLCTYRPWLALSVGTTYGVSVHFYCVTVFFNKHGFAIHFYAFWVAIRFHRHGPSIRSSSNWILPSLYVPFPPNSIFRLDAPHRGSRPTTRTSPSSPAT